MDRLAYRRSLGLPGTSGFKGMEDNEGDGTMKINRFHPHASELMGYIPQFLLGHDPRSAAEQFNERYAHGGGWRPFDGFVLNHENGSIKYPGDPAYEPVAMIEFRDERIYIYPHAWVLILQPDGSYEVARMD